MNWTQAFALMLLALTRPMWAAFELHERVSFMPLEDGPSWWGRVVALDEMHGVLFLSDERDHCTWVFGKGGRGQAHGHLWHEWEVDVERGGTRRRGARLGGIRGL